eukprot:12592861-Ditylum_brightwellii.AAC.1
MENDEELIIRIDANKVDEQGSTLRKFQTCNDLVDVFTHMHSNAMPPHTYQYSDNRLDYILVTPALTSSIKSVELMLLGTSDNPVDQCSRNLVANNPACWEKYVKEETITTKGLIEKYKLLDKQITEFMLSTKKKCRKDKKGYLWSLKLVLAARCVRYWKTRSSNALKPRTAAVALLKLGKELNIPFSDLSIDKIQSNLTTAWKNLKQAQKQAAELQDEYLEEMAHLQITHNNTNIATIIKNIRHREEVKSSFKIIRPIAKGKEGGAVSYIKVPEPL